MNKLSINRLDFSVLLPGVVVVLLGLSIFYSIDTQIFKQQLLALIVGVVAYFIFLNIDYRIFGIFSKTTYAFMIVSLLILFLLGIESHGAVRWIDILGLRV